MTLPNSQVWLDILGFDPTNMSLDEVKQRTSMRIREMCNDLNQRADRRDIAQGIRRLERAGRLLEEHHWLRDK